MEINKKLNEDILSYCKANEIDDVNLFINKLLQDSFTILKYGAKPIIPIKETPKEEVVVKEKEEPTPVITKVDKKSNKIKNKENLNDLYDEN